MPFKPVGSLAVNGSGSANLRNDVTGFGAGVDKVCGIEDAAKFDCHPAGGATAEDCLGRGCCWKPLPGTELPYCYYPVGLTYYKWKDFVTTKVGLKGGAVLVKKSPYPGDVKRVEVEVIYETEDIVRIRVGARKAF